MKYLSQEGLSYLWSKVKAVLPKATTTSPKMNGTATVGTEDAWARGDHVHPSDTTKVDKVEGKGLSTNDYTTADKEKLAGIAENANNYSLPNATKTALGGVIVGTNISVNEGTISVADGSTSAKGVVQMSDSVESDSSATAATSKSVKTVNDNLSAHAQQSIHITESERTAWNAKSDFSGSYNDLEDLPTIPSNNKQLTNGAGYQTASDVAAAIAAAEHLKREKVATLPAVSAAKENVIYLVPKTGPGDDTYDEYLLIDGVLELIGNSRVDLSGYVEETDLVAITNAEIDAIAV